MKTINPILGIITLFLSGCSNTKVVHVDAEEFLKHAEVMDGMHSALSATYIGSTYNREYLEVNDYITFIRKAPVTYIYWTEIDSLPKDVAETIKTGQRPWTPTTHKGKSFFNFHLKLPAYIDDPTMTDRLKQRADDQLRIHSPWMVEPVN